MAKGEYVTIPHVWSVEDRVVERDNGYLYIDDEGGNGGTVAGDSAGDEKTPLVLFSTQVLLQKLYPDLSLSEIFSIVRPPVIQEPDVEDAQHEAAPESTSESAEASGPGAKNPEPTGVSNDVIAGKQENQSTPSPQPSDQDTEMPDTPTGETEADRTDMDAKKKKGRGSGSNKTNKDGEQKLKPLPPQYRPYQDLVRDETIANDIERVVLDLLKFRHRKGKKERGADQKEETEKISRAEMRLKAIEHEQNRLRHKLSEDAATDQTVGAGVASDGQSQPAEVIADAVAATETDRLAAAEHDQDVGGGEDADDNGDDDDDDNMNDPPPLRLLRAINSIRAIVPHLSVILNHKRYNDKHLIIGGTKWKNRKGKPMCWLIGSSVFDVTNTRRRAMLIGDIRAILSTFIPHATARAVVDDNTGSPEFWSEQWIPAVLDFSVPKLADPLTRLKQLASEERILAVAEKLDEVDALAKEAPMAEKQKQYQAAIRKLHKRLTGLLTGRFPKARLSIYGSCLSDLSLGVGADVDLSFWLPEVRDIRERLRDGTIEVSQYEKMMKKFVYQVCRRIEYQEGEFDNMFPVTRARVPVVQGVYLNANNPFCEDGTLNFDICFMNDIAVANSGLIREYSIIDIRVKRLILAVKRWAKQHDINSARTNYVSSYAWVNLVLFYLQCHGYIPNLQSPELMERVGKTPNPKGNYWHCVNDLDTFTLTWADVEKAGVWTPPQVFLDTPIPLLVYGFFDFYCNRFPTALYGVSIKRGNISLPRFAFRKRVAFICIEDPFETHDSHCPHDLGIPASDRGAREMMELMRAAEIHLREVLTGQKESDLMWPPKSIDFGKNNGDRSRRRKQKQGDGKAENGGTAAAATGSEDGGDGHLRQRGRSKKGVNNDKSNVSTGTQGGRGGQGRGSRGGGRGGQGRGGRGGGRGGGGRRDNRGGGRRGGRGRGNRDGRGTRKPTLDDYF